MHVLIPLILLSASLLPGCGSKGDDSAGGTSDGGTSDGGTSDGGSGDGGTSDGGTSDGGSTGGLTSGDGFAIVYAASTDIGLDGRAPVSATFDADGQLAGYLWSKVEAPTRGDCSTADLGTLGDVSWGRWKDGTLGGAFYGGTFSYPADDGFHYGVAAAPQLKGSLGLDGAYTLVAATAPTLSGGSVGPGSATASATVIAGDTPMVSLQIQVVQGGETMTIQSPGYPDASLAGSTVWEGQVSGPATATGGPLCSTASCDVYLRGVFADDGHTLVIAYQAATSERVSGVVVLQQE